MGACCAPPIGNASSDDGLIADGVLNENDYLSFMTGILMILHVKDPRKVRNYSSVEGKGLVLNYENLGSQILTLPAGGGYGAVAAALICP